MINRTAQKKLAMLVWGTSALGAVALAASVVAAYQVHCVVDRERHLLEERRRDDLSLLARAEQVRADRDTAQARLDLLTSKLAKLKSYLPPSPKEAEFLAQVSALAERSGVRLKQFRPGQAVPAG